MILYLSDDTYMYDDAARGALGRNNQGHWYDEPPYESDPDDFLMSGMGPAATIQVSLLFFTITDKNRHENLLIRISINCKWKFPNFCNSFRKFDV